MKETEILLGNKLREKRKELGLTLDKLAGRTGVARTTISKIERDIISPSFNTLAKIARGMNIKVTQLIDDEPTEEEVVTRKKDRRTTQLNGSGCRVESLARGVNNMQIEVVKMTIVSGGESGMDPAHEGEEVIICVKGNVEFHIGTNVYELNKGDSLHFRPNRESGLFNRGTREAEVLWIYTPPGLH